MVKLMLLFTILGGCCEGKYPYKPCGECYPVTIGHSMVIACQCERRLR